MGVAFKLCQALYKMRFPDEPLWDGNTEFVALGTVADIVPLWGENRALVKHGLKNMETTESGAKTARWLSTGLKRWKQRKTLG